MRPRPFIFLNVVSSLNGRIDPPGGQMRLLSSDADKKQMDKLRSGADAILIGAKTFCEPRAHVTIRAESLRKKRVDSGKSANPTVVTISKTGRRLLGSKLIRQDDFDKIIFLGNGAASTNVNKLSKYAKVYQFHTKEVSINEVCRVLARDYKVKRLLVEGGAKINAIFFKGDLVDEVNLTLAPILLGGHKGKGIIDGEIFGLANKTRFKLVKASKTGNDVFLTYKRKKSR